MPSSTQRTKSSGTTARNPNLAALGNFGNESFVVAFGIDALSGDYRAVSAHGHRICKPLKSL